MNPLYRCLDCGRENFTKPMPHNCGGTFRKGKENLHFEPMSATADPSSGGKNEIVKAGAADAALLNLSVPQLAQAFGKLDLVSENCEKLSGICATLKGLVLCEVKRKLAHGKFLPWLQEFFPKSRKTATLHMRLAESFAKCEPRFTFEALGQDLGATLEILEANKLDLKNPLVAKVAHWTKGQSRYQLLLDLGPARLGGHHPRSDGLPRAERRTQEEILTELAQQRFDEFFKRDLEEWLRDKMYQRMDDQRLLELCRLTMDLYHAARDFKTRRGI